MRKKTLIVSGLLVTAIGLMAGGATSAAAAATNAIKNGGFEKPVAGFGSFIPFNQGTSFSHWQVVGAVGNVALVSGGFAQNGFTFPAKSGSQWLDLTGISQSATGVQQTVPTVASSEYTLTFFVGNVVDPDGIFGTSSTVDVYVDGSIVDAATNSKGAGKTTQVWQRFSVTFPTPNPTTTIAFINGDPATDTSNALDGVKLTQIT